MSVAENKALMYRYNEALNSSDWKTQLRPFFDDETAWKEWCAEHAAFRRSFPDYHSELEGMIGEGDQVALWSTVTGTFSEPYNAGGLDGIEPTGQQLNWREMVVVDFSKSEPEVIIIIDEMARLRQLGVMK